MFNQAFLCFLLARVCTSSASTVLSVAIGWHLYQATGDPFDLALVGLMQILPIIGLFIVSGWVVDHFPRRSVLLVCTGIQLLSYLGLALAIGEGIGDTTPVFALLFLNGCARAFLAPAMQAVLPNIVPPEHLPRAVAITSTSWTAAMTAGPFIAGLMLAWLDFGTYWLLVALAVTAAALLSRLPRLPAAQHSQRSLEDLLGGVRYVWRNPIVLPSITLDMLIVLAGSVVALLPVYAADVLEVGPEALGLLRAMPALGSVLAGALMARMGAMTRAGNNLFVALFVFSLSIAVFALSQNLWLSLAALFVYGASDMVSVNIRSTLVQLATPDELRGRVSAVNSLFIATSNDLGDFRAGAVAAAIGAVPAVGLGAVSALLITGIGYRLSPRLARLGTMEEAAIGDNK